MEVKLGGGLRVVCEALVWESILLRDVEVALSLVDSYRSSMNVMTVLGVMSSMTKSDLVSPSA